MSSIAMLNRTVPYFYRTGTFGSETYRRTVPYFIVPVRFGAKRPKAYRTVPPSYRRGTAVRSVRRIVRAQKNHPEGWLIVKLMLVWLQMHFQLFRQPSFVNLSFIKGLKKQAGGTWKISTACNPVEDRTGGAAGDEGQILVADVVAVEECLQVSHSKSSTSSIRKAILPILGRLTRRLRCSL